MKASNIFNAYHCIKIRKGDLWEKVLGKGINMETALKKIEKAFTPEASKYSKKTRK